MSAASRGGAMSRETKKKTTTKRKQQAPAKPKTNLASLHAMTLRGDSKTLLPAETIAHVLDFLPIPDLMRFSQTSKRMQEMVYDDTRWIQKLNLMGCWSESEARRRTDESVKRTHEIQKAKDNSEAKKAVNHTPSDANDESDRMKESSTVFDVDLHSHRQQLASNSDEPHNATQLSRNMKSISIHHSLAEDRASPTEVLNSVRSIRGRARHEFAKVYSSLSPYYFDLVRAQNHFEPKVFQEFINPLHQAKMLAQLQRFSQCDTALGSLQRESAVDSMIAVFENAALHEFEKGFTANDVDGAMKKYAHVLVALNGGAAAVDMYIQNHTLMTGKYRLGNPLACLEGSYSGQVDLSPSQDFFQQLSRTFHKESQTVQNVFPDQVDVMTPFLDRVTDEIISEYITLLFDEAHKGNKESYIKLVSGVFAQSMQFAKSVADLKAMNEEFGRKAMKSIGRCYEPHFDLYLREELDFFTNKTTSEVESWENRLSAQDASTESFYMSNVGRQAEKKDFMASFKKVVMMPVNALPSRPISTNKATAASESAHASRSTTPAPDSTIERSQTPKAESSAPTTELAAKAAIMHSKLEGIGTLFSLEVALNLVHTAKASLERTAQFAQLGGVPADAARDQCRATFVQLIELLGFRHVKAGLDKAVGHLSQYSASEAAQHAGDSGGVRPLVTFLELVNVGDLIQQMVDVFYTQELVAAGLVDPENFLDPAVKQKKRFEQALDERVAAGLSKGIDALLDEVEYLCATTQGAYDFRPDEAPASAAAGARPVDIGASATATQVVALVSSHTAMLSGSTDKNMLDVFNAEVGLRLFGALCKHLKRHRVSTAGAVTLIADTNAYFGFVATLRNKELLRYFMALRELSQIFLVDGRDAKELATIVADAERYYGVWRVEEVLEFAERRTDWYAIKGNVEKAMYGIGCDVM